MVETKIQRMYAAVGGLHTPLETLEDFQYFKQTPGMLEWGLDFTIKTKEEMARVLNLAMTTVANIAGLKDPLKIWCRDNNVVFNTEQFITDSKYLAIVYDLWNVDKHIELNRPPRSNCTPKLEDVRYPLFFGVDSSGNQCTMRVLYAKVVDEHGNELGLFQDICVKALHEWETVFQQLNISLK